MTNSLVHSLDGYFHALFKDLACEYGKASECERDLNRSLHELVIRGDRFVTIDLPALRKHLEWCLDQGLYVPSNLYLSGMVSKRVQVPAYGRDLYLKIFDQQGKLRPEPSASAVSALRQLYEGWGKLKNVCKQKAISDEVSNFVAIEANLRSPSLDWGSDVLFRDNTSHRSVSFQDQVLHVRDLDPLLPLDLPVEDSIGLADSQTLQKVCDIIASSLGDFSIEIDDNDRTERPKHGTGRVSNLPRNHSKYDFKFWPKKLDLVYPYDRYAENDLSYQQYCNDFAGVLRNHEEPSKLIAVPKTMSGPRLIGSEPNYHQWIQQLVRNQIEARIPSSLLGPCISFGDQRPNRELALQGSKDGSIATVDLKSASDRLSCWTVERALRANLTLLERIHACRTRVMRNAIDDRFSSLILKKCFTQGSACTFPVQTVVYSMVCIASIIITDGKRPTTRNIASASLETRVFGDDIVIPVRALPKLVEILSFLQLKVNSAKTFSKGMFRESCGLDAFAGVDVTPARVKRFSANPSHEVVSSMIKCSNNYFERGYWNVAEWLRSFLRQYEVPVRKLSRVHSMEQHIGRQDDLYVSDGYSAFSGDDFSHLKKRWNKNLHREEYRASLLTSKSKKVATQSAHDLMEFTSTKRTRIPHLEFLHPPKGGLGVVDKSSSVMRRGWIPFPSTPNSHLAS